MNHSPINEWELAGGLRHVDQSRLGQALDTIDYLLEHLNSEGRYEVQERWGAESELYSFAISSNLIEAYQVTGKTEYLDGTRKIFDRLKRTQLPSGGWTLNLSEGGQEFKVNQKQQRESWETESLPNAGAFAYSVAKYRRVIGDNKYDEMIDRAVDGLLRHWDPESGRFAETVALRYNASTYQVLFLLGLRPWMQWRPELKTVVEKLEDTICQAFESFDDHAMPFIWSLHAVTLMQICSTEYLFQEIKPRLDALIKSPIYKCLGIMGGYGHRDGNRGIVNTEANMRGGGMIALAMKMFDLATGTRSYGDTVEYRDVALWIDSMKGRRGYFEYQMRDNLARKGQGSPGQFIPCWWIMGAL